MHEVYYKKTCYLYGFGVLLLFKNSSLLKSNKHSTSTHKFDWPCLVWQCEYKLFGLDNIVWQYITFLMPLSICIFWSSCRAYVNNAILLASCTKAHYTWHNLCIIELARKRVSLYVHYLVSLNNVVRRYRNF